MSFEDCGHRSREEAVIMPMVRSIVDKRRTESLPDECLSVIGSGGLSLSAPPLAGPALPHVGTNRPHRWGAGLCVLRWGVGVDGRATGGKAVGALTRVSLFRVIG